MSRTRIVKGKYTKLSLKGHSMYSNENIVTTASDFVTEKGEEKGVSYGDPSKSSAGKINAKCIVHFRPHDKWNGEFGFDWIRMGDNDTGRKGDKYWYRDIIGKYRDSKKKLLQEFNGGTFKKSNDEYDNLLKQFNLFNVVWKNDLYVVPILSLMPNSKAKFTLKVEIKEQPKELRYKINSKYYKLNKDKIAYNTVGKKTLYNDLEITNIAAHNAYEYLDVIAVSESGFEETVGRMRINPNNVAHQKKMTVALINVHNGKGNFSTLNLESRKKEITKYLNQALIIPSFVTANLHINRLSASQKKKFEDSYRIYGPTSSDVFDVLYETMIKFDPKYTDYMKIFFIDDVAGGLFGQTMDIGIPEKSVVVLNIGFNDSTLVHEALHAMNLYHTFDNDSKFTFLNFETDNVMDYSDFENRKFPVISTFAWQWNILHKFLK
ncbi:hypothetical protein [Epilithonimonas sp.]|uniref:hypothetical protein n=1 Tax=Epilithonimonas sp. TaxID=2894511 RepID=UPI002FDC9AD8